MDKNGNVNDINKLDRLGHRKLWIIHIIVLCIAALIMTFCATEITSAFQNEEVSESVEQEERLALNLAENKYEDEVQNDTIRKQQDELAKQRLLDASFVLMDRWEYYRDQKAAPADSADTESNPASSENGEDSSLMVPSGMDISRQQLMEHIQKTLDAKLVELDFDDDNEETVLIIDSENTRLVGIPDNIRTRLQEKLNAESWGFVTDGQYFYSAEKSNGKTLFAVFSNTSSYIGNNITDSLRNYLGSLKFGLHNCGRIVLLNVKDDTVLAAFSDDKVGSSISDAGFEYASDREDTSMEQRIWDTDYIVNYRHISDSLVLCALMEKEPISQYVYQTIILNAVIFIIVLIAVLLYVAVQLSAGWGRTRVKTRKLGHFGYIDISLANHMIPVVLVCVLLVFLASFYGQELVTLSLKTMEHSSRLDQIHLDQNEDKTTYNTLVLTTQTEYLDRMKVLNDWLDMDPGFYDTDNLKKLAASLELESVDIYTGTDYTLAAATSQQGNVLTESDHADYNEIMTGTAKNKITILNDGSSSEGYRCEVAVRRTDGSGIAIAVLNDNIVTKYSTTVQDNDTIANYYSGPDEEYIAIDAETHTVKSSSTSSWVGLSTEELGITENMFENHYSGFQSIDGDKYFATAKKNGDIYELVGTLTNSLTRSSLQNVLIVPIITLLLMMIFMVLSVICPGSFIEQGKKPDGISFLDWDAEEQAEEEEGLISKKKREWHMMNPEDRYTSLFKGFLLITAFFIVTSIIYGIRLEELADQKGILWYIGYGDWDYGVNIFAITEIIIIICMGSMISWLVRWIIRRIASFFGRHTESVANILDGFIGYLFAIGILFLSLAQLGVKTSLLATGAGVISVVIGIGAQSLVGDILTGIFIVMENEFSKGDMVQIEDWQGRVTEIGIRTTKVRDIHGNVKIFNNSVIRSVINKSTENTIAHILISISYEEDLKKVETLLKNSMADLRKAVPLLLQDPIYFGVEELGDSAVVLSVHVVCREENLIQVSAQTRRELKLLFDANGIEIPYAQIVVHSKEDGGKA